MREIEFRAWDKNDKEMFNIIMIAWPQGRELRTIVSGRGGSVDNPILMQYTGLKDKNGKKIFEGDILDINDQITVVEWVEGVACFSGLQFVKGKFNQAQCVVIGNIYENPELLKLN